MRGVIPRAVLRQVIEATYVQLWWPTFDQPIYVHRQPVWTGVGYCDPDTGVMLPTWDEALDQLQSDPDAKPAHVMRFGAQYDMAGSPAAAPPRPMIENISVAAAAASWSPETGPAKPCASTKLTAQRWFVKRWTRRDAHS
jgi:hypothetical protein